MRKYSDLNDYELMYLISESNDEVSDIIFEKYYPLIDKLARDFYKLSKQYGLDKDDFIQEGYVGLFEAIKHFTEGKNTLFYTYAKISIESKMRNLLAKHSSDKNKPLNESCSLNVNIHDDEDSELLDFLEDSYEKLPDIETEKNLFYEELEQILLSMPIKYSSIFELKLNGFSNKDISALLEVSIAYICYALNFARKRCNSLKNYF